MRNTQTDPPRDPAMEDAEAETIALNAILDDLVDEAEGEDEPLPDEDNPANEAKPRKLSSSQRKSRKIAAQARALAERDTLIAELMQEIARLQGQPVEAPEGVRAEDFPDDETYQQAKVEEIVAKAVRGINEEERQRAAYHELMRAQQERQTLAREQFEERLESARPMMPDFDAKVEALLARLEEAKAGLPAHVVEEIHLNQKGPELLYLMAGDDGFLLELMQSDPVAAARAIGRREALLAATKQKLQSTAPEPRQAPRGGSGAARDPEAMSYADYRKWRGYEKS